MSKSTATLPDWERVLIAAARLQSILPDAVLVGGTASAVHAHHRVSQDADHVLTDLISRFDEVLAQLESVAGWKTARVRRPVLILGSLDGIETGIRQLIRGEPLETCVVERHGARITLPTAAEILRIKAVLILKRNATRDYIDFAALAAALGTEAAADALGTFDDLYPQENGESPLQQLLAQITNAQPFDLSETDLTEYKHLDPRWHDWAGVQAVCDDLAGELFDRLEGFDPAPEPGGFQP